MKRVAASVVIGSALLLTAACGSSSSPSSTSAAASASESSAPASDAAPQPTSTRTSASDLPDPCALLSEDQIAAVLGSDPGEGKPNDVDLVVRRVCLYPSGLVLGVELAENYYQAIAEVSDPGVGATTREVTGLGESAFAATTGEGASQALALQGDYFVSVTGRFPVDNALVLAKDMLGALA